MFYKWCGNFWWTVCFAAWGAFSSSVWLEKNSKSWCTKTVLPEGVKENTLTHFPDVFLFLYSLFCVLCSLFLALSRNVPSVSLEIFLLNNLMFSSEFSHSWCFPSNSVFILFYSLIFDVFSPNSNYFFSL